MLVKLWMKKIIILCLMIKFLNGMNFFIESISKLNPENQQVFTSFDEAIQNLSSSVKDENIILVRTNITIAKKLQILKNLIIE